MDLSKSEVWANFFSRILESEGPEAFDDVVSSANALEYWSASGWQCWHLDSTKRLYLSIYVIHLEWKVNIPIFPSQFLRYQGCEAGWVDCWPKFNLDVWHHRCTHICEKLLLALALTRFEPELLLRSIGGLAIDMPHWKLVSFPANSRSTPIASTYLSEKLTIRDEGGLVQFLIVFSVSDSSTTRVRCM